MYIYLCGNVRAHSAGTQSHRMDEFRACLKGILHVGINFLSDVLFQFYQLTQTMAITLRV